jgi:flavin reductase (DIM6/NTAB) family NADH-FMN oxidoreductase RutF
MSSQLSADSFKSLMRGHPGGVAIITLCNGEQPIGFTATSVISVSASPPVLVFSVQRGSSSLAALERSASVVIHFLDRNHHRLAVRFATSGIDRFEHTPWRPLPTGEPLLDDVGTWVRCTILDRAVAGSAVLIQACPQQAEITTSRAPILYHDRAFHGLGDAAPG